MQQERVQREPPRHAAVDVNWRPQQCPFQQSHNRRNSLSLVLPPSPLFSATNAKFFTLFLRWARAEEWQLAVFRGAWALRSLSLCVRLEPWGEHNRLATLVHLCRKWHLYRLLCSSESVTVSLSFTLHSAVVVFYTFPRPTRLLSPSSPHSASTSDICACFASGHQLELEYNTAGDSHTFL